MIRSFPHRAWLKQPLFLTLLVPPVFVFQWPHQMQKITGVIHRGVFKPYSIDIDGDIEADIGSPPSQDKFLFQRENGKTVSRLTRPQPGLTVGGRIYYLY